MEENYMRQVKMKSNRDYAWEKLQDTMALLRKAEDADERKALREQAAAYATIVTAYDV